MREVRELIRSLGFVARQELVFGMHVHVGMGDPEEAIHVSNAMRPYIPLLIALSANSPLWRGEPTGLSSSRQMVFAAFPRSGPPPRFNDYADYAAVVGQLEKTGCIPDYTHIWWDIRLHPRLGTIEIRICDAQPDLDEARSLSALAYSLTARLARALDEGERLPDHPHRLVEENFWRAIRYGLSGELIDFESGESIPARARLEQLVEWVQPVAEELGAAPWLAIPERNAAERQIARHEEGASMEEIFAEQVRAGERVGG